MRGVCIGFYFPDYPEGKQWKIEGSPEYRDVSHWTFLPETPRPKKWKAWKEKR